MTLMTMEILLEMKYQQAKRMLDKKAPYYWEYRVEGRYALVNEVTMKTVLGVNSRLDAIALTRSLIQEGYKIAKMDDLGD